MNWRLRLAACIVVAEMAIAVVNVLSNPMNRAPGTVITSLVIVSAMTAAMVWGLWRGQAFALIVVAVLHAGGAGLALTRHRDWSLAAATSIAAAIAVVGLVIPQFVGGAAAGDGVQQKSRRRPRSADRRTLVWRLGIATGAATLFGGSLLADALFQVIPDSARAYATIASWAMVAVSVQLVGRWWLLWRVDDTVRR